MPAPSACRMSNVSGFLCESWNSPDIPDTPDPCQLLTAEFTRSSQDLHLRVSTRSTGGACILILGRFAYTAVIIGLPAGVYNFDVTHTYPNTGWPTSVVVTQSAKVE